MKIRIKFIKEDLMQYIGHLDFVRAWQKIFRRSGIPIAYSEGFNPHQVFSIAAPLAIGVTSEGEYLDLKLKVDEYNLDELVSRINQVCPEGIKVIQAHEITGKQTAAMAACLAATYRIDFSDALFQSVMQGDGFDSYLSQEHIIVQKKNKKGKLNDLDLKQGVYDYSIKDRTLFVTLATGSSLNIKPELLLEGFFQKNGFHFDMDGEFYYNVHRLDIYGEMNPRKDLIQVLMS